MRSILSILALSAVISLTSFSGVSARGGFNSQLNMPSYWGDNCVKFENFSDNIYSYSTSNDDTTKVIIKAATKVAVYDDGDFENLSSPINSKNNKPFAISHVIECYGQSQDDPIEEPEKPNEGDKVWICHWTEGVLGYILINVSVNGAENGHLGEHHHHNKDFVVNEGDSCNNDEEPLDCDDQIYYQDNLDICDPEDQDEDDPEVLGETDPKGVGGDEILAETGAETAVAMSVASGTLASALAAVRMSKPSKEEELSEISL